VWDVGAHTSHEMLAEEQLRKAGNAVGAGTWGDLYVHEPNPGRQLPAFSHSGSAAAAAGTPLQVRSAALRPGGCTCLIHEPRLLWPVQRNRYPLSLRSPPHRSCEILVCDTSATT
jgi:hypothetical protein